MYITTFLLYFVTPRMALYEPKHFVVKLYNTKTLIVIFSQVWIEKWQIILNRFCFHGAGLNVNTDPAAVLRQPNGISSPSATSWYHYNDIPMAGQHWSDIFPQIWTKPIVSYIKIHICDFCYLVVIFVIININLTLSAEHLLQTN